MQTYSDILVSVVMPVYNGALYLKEAVDSILSQTHTNLELIIVNDGSTDNSEQIIQSYTDERIVYLKNEVNSKICVTLNRGLDVAQGKYIARMDCDDISVPERLQMQVEYMEQNPNIGVLGSDIIVFGEGIEERIFTFEHDKNCCKAGLIFSSCFAHPAVMMRKSLLDQHNFRYNEEYRGFEDFELWRVISKYTEIINIPMPLLRYRKHKSQETQNRSPIVLNKIHKFLYDGVSEYVSLKKDEFTLFIDYIRNDWTVFDKENIYILLSIFARIIHTKPVALDKNFKRAMQITLSKAIVFAMKNSDKITTSKRRVYTKALVEGVMPFDWYVKFMYHTFI